MSKRTIPLLLSLILLGIFIYEAFVGPNLYTTIASLSLAGILAFLLFIPSLLSLFKIRKQWLDAVYSFAGLGFMWTGIAFLLFPGSTSFAGLAGIAGLAIFLNWSDSISGPKPPDYPRAPETENLTLNTSDMVPADGTISEGIALVDESNVEGEWLPRVKQTGDVLYSGSKIIEGSVRLHCERTGVDSFFYKVATMNDTFTYPPLSGFSSIAAPFLFFFVLAVTLIGTLVSLFTGFTAEFPGLLAASMLIGGLGLSKLIQIVRFNSSAMYCYTSRAIVQAANTTTLLLDSRSIISLKKFSVAEVISDNDPEELMNYAFALSSASSNPLAQAIHQYTLEFITQNINIDSSEEGFSIHSLESSDLSAKYELVDFTELTKRNIDFSSYEIDIRANQADARDFYILLKDDTIFGMFILKEEYKNIPFSSIPGCRTNIISGEDKMKTIIAANELDIDGIIHSPRPADRAKTVEEMQNRAEVVSYAAESFSGIAALKQADTGISISNKLANSDAWIATAELLPHFFTRAKSLHESERISTLFSLVYALIIPVILFITPSFFIPLLLSSFIIPPGLLILLDIFFTLTRQPRPETKVSEDLFSSTENSEVEHTAGEAE